MKVPALTYIITSYNYGTFLQENLESLCKQWSEENEFKILIVDDGSVDNSLEIIRDFLKRYNFISLLTHPEHRNCGLVKSLTLAVNSVNTPWVSFLESDDVSSSGAVTKLSEKLDSGAGLIFWDIEPIGRTTGKDIWFDSYVPRIRREMMKINADKHPVNLDRKILEENLIPTFSCCAVKTELLKSADFNSPVPEWIDWYLWVQICQETKILYIDKKLVKWRLHADSFNRKKKLLEYLIKYRLFRGKIRETLFSAEIRDKYYKIAYLFLPSFVPLLVRFMKMAKYKGYRTVFNQIRWRLKK